MGNFKMEYLDEIIKDLETRIFNGEEKLGYNLDALLTCKGILLNQPKIINKYENKIAGLNAIVYNMIKLLPQELKGKYLEYVEKGYYDLFLAQLKEDFE